MDCSSPDSYVRGILQARVLEWVAIPFTRGHSWPREQTWVSCKAGRSHLSHQGSPTSEKPTTKDYILDNSIYVKFRDFPKLTSSDGNQNSGQLWELWSWSWRVGNVPYPDVSIDGRYKNAKSCHNIYIRLVHFMEYLDYLCTTPQWKSKIKFKITNIFIG